MLTLTLQYADFLALMSYKYFTNFCWHFIFNYLLCFILSFSKYVYERIVRKENILFYFVQHIVIGLFRKTFTVLTVMAMTQIGTKKAVTLWQFVCDLVSASNNHNMLIITSQKAFRKYHGNWLLYVFRAMIFQFYQNIKSENCFD